MFTDLTDSVIQPEEIKVGIVHEIELSKALQVKIQTMLEQEEKSFVEVSEKTTIVKLDKDYVFFPNQWFYLAVNCKKYAIALYSYCNFFENKIKTDINIFNCIEEGNNNNPVLLNFFENETDINNMIKFVNGDKDFRPGKRITNDTKDIFCSCILEKLAVAKTSSTYLGKLVYYLAKSPNIFDELENEINIQLRLANLTIKLPSIVKECAKVIIDWVYRIDSFEKLKPFIVDTGKSIKIVTSGMQGEVANGNFLRYVFAKPSSELYSTEGLGKSRVFTDKTYNFDINDRIEKCRLTTEWVDSEINPKVNGNNLRALIEVINELYSGIIRITEEAGSRYLFILDDNFTLNSLPESFRTDFSRRYITSLLAKPFVILTGNSGTGKTRIAKLLAEYFEVEPEAGGKNWELVPVGADWTDNTNILGFYNPLADENKGKYVKTSIIKLIESANQNRDIPHFLILDEMNLSHVERYFSDFLSHMETPEIPFVLDGNEGELKFTSNIFVIGTVNIDETTYMFSPKVLDRANVIEFKPEKAAVMDMFLNPVNSNTMHAANDGSAEMFLKLSKEIRSGKCKIDTQMKDVQELFDKIYQVTEKYEYEFAYRTVKEIRQYISAAYELKGETDEFNLTDSMDEQLLQKILPKIHGNKKEIGELLEELEKICIDNKLTLSEKKLKQMKGKVARVQYASFI